MIRISNLTLARGAKRLLEGANLTVHAGHKVGVVGPNGCGKSSLFALLRGELHADAGDVELPAAWTISHVAQETPAVPAPALEFVLDGDRELREVERALRAAEAAAAIDPEQAGETLALFITASRRSAGTPHGRARRRCSRASAFRLRGMATPSLASRAASGCG